MQPSTQTLFSSHKTHCDDKCRQAQDNIMHCACKDNLLQRQMEEMIKAQLLEIHGYYDTVEAELVRQNEVSSALAIKFKKPLDVVMQDIQYHSKVTLQCKVNSHNAWKHLKSMNLNVLGEFSFYIIKPAIYLLFTALEVTDDERNLLHSLQDLDDKDGYTEFKKLPDKLFSLVVDELDAYRHQQMRGQKSMSKVRSQDIRRTAEKVTQEASQLYLCHDMLSIIIIIRVA